MYHTSTTLLSELRWIEASYWDKTQQRFKQLEEIGGAGSCILFSFGGFYGTLIQYMTYNVKCI